jgi:prepilin-type N-terminal cleavage/methylation domain-containing protein
MQNRKLNRGFTLVEIMIVVAIIALLAAIAVPGFLRARKRSQGTTIKNDLRLIDAGIDQYAIEYNLASGPVTSAQVIIYLKPGTRLANTFQDILGNNYASTFTLGSLPGVNTNSAQALSDVCDAAFFSPYPTS